MSGGPSTAKRSGQPSPTAAGFSEQRLAFNLRYWRRDRNLTQADVAVRMRSLGHETWSAVTVSQVETCDRTLGATEMLRLALVIGASIPEMLAGVVVDRSA